MQGNDTYGPFDALCLLVGQSMAETITSNGQCPYRTIPNPHVVYVQADTSVIGIEDDAMDSSDFEHLY